MNTKKKAKPNAILHALRRLYELPDGAGSEHIEERASFMARQPPEIREYIGDLLLYGVVSELAALRRQLGRHAAELDEGMQEFAGAFFDALSDLRGTSGDDDDTDDDDGAADDDAEDVDGPRQRPGLLDDTVDDDDANTADLDELEDAPPIDEAPAAAPPSKRQPRPRRGPKPGEPAISS
jgi:hypothetical protein